MGPYEALHQRFVNVSTSGFTLLSILDPSFEDDPSKLIYNVMDIYHERDRENSADDKLHDAFRTLLCYQYQLHVENKIKSTADYPNEKLLDNLRRILFHSGDSNESTKAILNDVAILQIIFYSNQQGTEQLLSEALDFIEKQVNEGNNFQNYFSILEVLSDAVALQTKLSSETGGFVSTKLLETIKSWFQMIDENNSQVWRPFISLLFKLTRAINPPVVLTNVLWDCIQGYTQHTDEKSLTLLCGMIDDFFSNKSKDVLELNIKSILSGRVSLLISDHLTSNVQLHRKQAQYVLKKIVDYLREHPQEMTEWIRKMEKCKAKDGRQNEAEEQLKLPFIFCEDGNVSIEEIKSNYFVLLESLEEKQAHLVLPAMAHLDKLLEASTIHKSLLDRTWVKCIFARVLNHDNNGVIKAGLSALLRVDLHIFDDGFAALLVETLNKTFLYEDQSSDPHPQVLKDLSEFFIKAESSGINLTSRFIIKASKINWSPIPLVYVLEALGNNKEMPDVEHNVWGGEELEALRVITEKCVKQLIKIMRIPAQINILRCITIYVKPPLDFVAIGRILPSIVSDGVLTRGNEYWKLLANYLKKNTEESTAVISISKCCEYFLKSGTDDTDMNALAILIILMCDTGNVLFKASITSNCLYPIFVPIVDAYKRPYADHSLFHKALQMIGCLMELSSREDDHYIASIFGFSQSIFDLIMSSLRSNWPSLYETGKIHIRALAAILSIKGSYTESINSMINIGDEEIQKIMELISHQDTPVIRSWYALNILYLLDNSKGYDAIFGNALPKFHSNDGDGKIVSECYGLVANIYHDCIESNKKLLQESLKEILNEKLMILAETKSDEAVPHIFAILEFIIDDWMDYGEIINEFSGIIRDIINVCWKNLWDMSKTKVYWDSAELLINLIFSRNFLEVDKCRQMAVNYVNDIILKTDNSSALRCLLFRKMCQIQVDDIYIFRDAILSSLLQTDVGKINKRMEMQTCCYIMKNHKINFFKYSLDFGLGEYTDVITRASLVILMTRMAVQGKENIVKSYIPQLLSMLEKQKNKRYFGDSNVHRLKFRIMQILVLLSWKITEDDARTVHEALTQLILTESDQSSVRIMKEWILARLYTHHEPLRDLIWNLFPSARKNRPGSLTSFVSIVYHVAKSLGKSKQLEYVRKAITHILPSCFCQQFIVRLYSQVILSKLLEIMDRISPKESKKYESIREAVQESLRYGNLMTNSVKLLDNFYFSKFDSEENWDLHSIFYQIPRLTNVSVDEWISVEVFQLLSFRYMLNVTVPIRHNPDNDLSEIETPTVLKEPVTPDADSSHNEDFADIQRKIIPSTSGISTTDSMPTLMTRQKLITNDTGLIVIATLIEGFPNLGGLARTAEIFCAKELVLKSKRYTENKDFQSLSVTAEKWITISEVKPHELRDYLLEKKSKGWNLVGAEQTINSINLLDMKFNEKTILLLGNEKTGIPANLIQLLDTCVEIPQAGVVRSLNVHVTGAICMWQYAQQHLF
ncbi:probable methyltransferase TARBP1 [Diachasma alloeum]|uniref:probable methyltransferase TARBP1 n=1 Tax=Diachasma alloeum TaxID=454923 RepID=UPI0007384DD8|nr:probable methyltransferase TARBP1 [Diachasma alloeum]